MQHTTEELPGGTKVWVSQRHRFGTDALLLASFCEVKRNWRVCDMGTGCGIVLLSLIDKGLQGEAVGLELDEEGAALLRGTAEENGYNNVTALCQDLRGYRSDRLFDAITMNPPYFNGSILPPDAQRAAARHQTTCTLQDVAQTAAINLKDGGRLCLCYPASGLGELCGVLRDYKLEPKRMQLVRRSAQAQPWLVLMDARKMGGVGMTILPDRILIPGEPVAY